MLVTVTGIAAFATVLSAGCSAKTTIPVIISSIKNSSSIYRSLLLWCRFRYNIQDKFSASGIISPVCSSLFGLKRWFIAIFLIFVVKCAPSLGCEKVLIMGKVVEITCGY